MALILVSERGMVGVKQTATEFPAQVLRSVSEQGNKERAGFCACSGVTASVPLCPLAPWTFLIHQEAAFQHEGSIGML